MFLSLFASSRAGASDAYTAMGLPVPTANVTGSSYEGDGTGIKIAVLDDDLSNWTTMGLPAYTSACEVGATAVGGLTTNEERWDPTNYTCSCPPYTVPENQGNPPEGGHGTSLSALIADRLPNAQYRVILMRSDPNRPEVTAMREYCALREAFEGAITAESPSQVVVQSQTQLPLGPLTTDTGGTYTFLNEYIDSIAGEEYNLSGAAEAHYFVVSAGNDGRRSNWFPFAGETVDVSTLGPTGCNNPSGVDLDAPGNQAVLIKTPLGDTPEVHFHFDSAATNSRMEFNASNWHPGSSGFPVGAAVYVPGAAAPIWCFAPSDVGYQRTSVTLNATDEVVVRFVIPAGSSLPITDPINHGALFRLVGFGGAADGDSAFLDVERTAYQMGLPAGSRGALAVGAADAPAYNSVSSFFGFEDFSSKSAPGACGLDPSGSGQARYVAPDSGDGILIPKNAASSDYNGTSFSAPIVAGLLGSLITDPDMPLSAPGAASAELDRIATMPCTEATFTAAWGTAGRLAGTTPSLLDCRSGAGTTTLDPFTGSLGLTDFCEEGHRINFAPDPTSVGSADMSGCADFSDAVWDATGQAWVPVSPVPLDNDLDGAPNCDDPGCFGQPYGYDEDGDDSLPCEDCAPTDPLVGECEDTEVSCDDKLDNDADGRPDCSDSDCFGGPDCPGPTDTDTADTADTGDVPGPPEDTGCRKKCDSTGGQGSFAALVLAGILGTRFGRRRQ